MGTIKILSSNHIRFIFNRNVRALSTRNRNKAEPKKDNFEKNALHRVRKEVLYMYGPLRKKEKLPSKTSTNTVQNNSTIVDSELWWHLKHSKYMVKSCIKAKSSPVKQGSTIKIYKKTSRSSQSPKRNVVKLIVNREKNNITSVTSKSIQEAETIYDKHDTENKGNDVIKTVDNTDKLMTPTLKNVDPFNIVINKMTLFPIFNMTKNLPQIEGKMDIVSFSVKDEPATLHYPSITKILAATLSEESQRNLKLWKDKLIAEMGEDKFVEYYEEQLKMGRLFHSCIENTLYGRSVDVPDKVQSAFDSLSSIVEGLKDIRAIESHVAHQHLQYKGKIDCIAEYKGELCIIDWKKSEKQKSSLALTYDAPVQIAAYIGALNYSKKYPFTVNTGLIVVGYTNGQPADTYVIKNDTLQSFWKKWLKKLQQYWASISTTKQ